MTLSRKRMLLIAGGLILAGVAAIGASAILWPGQYEAEQTVDRSFTVDLDFNKVRKILVRTDALKRIITMTGESEFIEQQWSALGGGIDSLNPFDLGWKLELTGTLKVRTLDPYVGQSEVTLAQVVKIDRDQLHSDIELKEGSQRLRGYEMSVWFVRDEAGKTHVQQRLSQTILTHAPWFAHWIADRRVRQSAERALVNQEEAIRTVIDENRNQRWLLLDRLMTEKPSPEADPAVR